jgi:hypothetical protein
MKIAVLAISSMSLLRKLKEFITAAILGGRPFKRRLGGLPFPFGEASA